MTTKSAELVRLRLRCDSTSPRLARAALARLNEIRRVREEAVLIVSELATNAVQHSGCTPEDEFEVRAELVPSGLRIEVIDPGRSEQTPKRLSGSTGAAGGMGLRLVERLSRHWGSDTRGSTRVWAELSL